MDPRTAAKVGVVVLVGLGAFFAAWRFLAHLDFGTYPLYVQFSDTRGLLRQTPVRMNGVAVGEVADVQLQRGSLLPLVVLHISEDYAGQIPRNSAIRITAGLLITAPQIEITPPAVQADRAAPFQPGDTWPQQYVEAQPGSVLAQMSPEAEQTIRQLNVTLKTVNRRLGATMDQVYYATRQVRGILNRTAAMTANFEAASLSVRSLAGDPQIRLAMHATLRDLTLSTREVRDTARTMGSELRSVVRRNSGKFDELANSAVDLVQRLGDILDQTRGLLARLTEQVSGPRLQQSLVETLDLAQATIARFNQIASDLHQLTGDPDVQSNLKTTVTTVRETADEARALVERVGAIVGRIGVPAGRPRLGIGRPELSIDFLTRANAPHFRSDVNVRLPVADRNAIDLGLYDFGERYRLNAQYETDLGASSALRYGIYASKLGVGYDWRIAPGTRLKLDAYSPNSLRFDARALLRLNSDFSLWLGVDSLFSNPTPLIGVRLNR